MIERTILQNLIHNEEYCRKVLPFLKDEYFQEESDRHVFNEIQKYVGKYNNRPSVSALTIELGNSKISEKVYQECCEFLETGLEDEFDLDWLMDTTETFCMDKAIYLAVMETVQIIGGESKTKDKGAIPEILSNALSVSFDSSIGHDYLDDFESRWDFYHAEEQRIAFDLEIFNKITSGGFPKKTFNVFMASTGVGKSLLMSHMAAANLSAGLNVLYITNEMAEERIAERVDANLLNVPLNELKTISKDLFMKKVHKLKSKTVGKLIVKEYPTSSASAAHFRHLLHELKIKKKFVPDIVYIDYLNICISSRVKMGGSVNSYSYVKAIAEELRGLAVEQDIPIVSATQTNRDGMNSSDVDLTNVSESAGLSHTADFFAALISNDQLEELGQIMVKQLKNRYGDLNFYRRFVIGVDRSRMKLYDLDSSAQNDIMEVATTSNKSVGKRSKTETDKPVMDNSGFGERLFDDEFKSGKNRDFSALFG